MNQAAKPSIQRMLMFVLLLNGSSALFLTALAYGVNDWIAMRGAMTDRLMSQADIVANNSVAALAFHDVEAANMTLNSLENESELVGAVLFDVADRPFAIYHRNEHYALPMEPPSDASGFLGDQLFVSSPVVLDGRQVGSLVLVSELDYWDRQQMIQLATVAGVFLFSLLWVVILAGYLRRIMLRPILELTATAKQITRSGDFQLRAEKISQDEIGGLVDDFNEMLRQIQLRDEALLKVQSELEDKVEERTRELTELAQELERQAYHDALTGLANRATFDDHLQLAIHQAQRYGGELSVLFLDLDRFKNINDTLGHAVGDKLLIEASHRFQACLRSSDTLARLGGDEFAVLLVQTGSPNDAADVARKLIAAVNAPFSIDGYFLHVSASVGISIYPSDGADAQSILKNADTAMYHSKSNGRNQYTFFTESMNLRATRRLLLENKLRTAIDEKLFTLHYQPRFETQSKRIIGVEALIRWSDKEEGTISPIELIALADECGLITTIDEWVLETACREVLRWYDNQRPPIVLSVNLSGAQFIRRNLSQVIQSILRRTGFPGDCLELEITENVFGPNAVDVTAVLREIRELGVEISIDDFGKDYSSLSRLKQLPLQTLKIDKSFIRDIGKDPDGEILVKTMITMAHSLNLRVVAEGIEKEEQYRFVRRHHCDAVQGYLLGRPMPDTVMQERLRQELVVDLD